MLVHAAVLLLALTAFSALVFDLGVMYREPRGRRRMRPMPAPSPPRRRWRFVSTDDQALARNSAVAAAQQNLVWGEAPDVLGSDVTFPACPPGHPAWPEPVSGRMSFAPTTGGPAAIRCRRFSPTSSASVNRARGPWRRRRCWPAPARPIASSPGRSPTGGIENLPLPSDTFSRYVQAGPGAGTLLPPPRMFTRRRARERTGTGYRLPEIRHRSARSRWVSPGDFARRIVYLPGGDQWRAAVSGVRLRDARRHTITPGTV